MSLLITITRVKLADVLGLALLLAVALAELLDQVTHVFAPLQESVACVANSETEARGPRKVGGGKERAGRKEAGCSRKVRGVSSGAGNGAGAGASAGG